MGTSPGAGSSSDSGFGSAVEGGGRNASASRVHTPREKAAPGLAPLPTQSVSCERSNFGRSWSGSPAFSDALYGIGQVVDDAGASANRTGSRMACGAVSTGVSGEVCAVSGAASRGAGGAAGGAPLREGEAPREAAASDSSEPEAFCFDVCCVQDTNATSVAIPTPSNLSFPANETMSPRLTFSSSSFSSSRDVPRPL